MTDRARHTYALLRTLFAWTPAPTASRTGQVLASQQRGFVTAKRYLTCPDCLANGRPEGMRGCETCKGRGEVPDDGGDPYEVKRVVGYGFADYDRAKDRERRIDGELARLEQQLAKPESKLAERVDRIDPRVAEAAADYRDRMYKQGSYAALELALAKLRHDDRVAYEVAMTVAYQPLCVEPIEPVRAVVVALCEVLAGWMPDEIRVPAGVPVWTADELKAQAAVMRERATWRGRKDPLAVARRDDAIRRLVAEGLSEVEVAERVGVHPRTVARVLHRAEAA